MKALRTHARQRDLNAELLETELALRRAEVRQALWALPTVNNFDVPLALGLGQAIWETMKRNGTAPAPVRFGRRVLYRTSDLQRWLAEQPTSEVSASDDNGHDD